ncbi:MAG: glycoside hydrolase family 2, partial [Candidatus Aminicenantes bacterium]|nr:glycoside hydrolase family 2 [Candidatus Aminicenantes bacterium]
TDDLFLAEDPKRIEAQIKYAKHLNLNTLRLEGFWGSSKTLYDLADQYGILLMAGWSCHWEWEDYAGKPVDEFGGVQTAEEMDLISRSLRDQVVWLRNHPSIFVWVLGSDKLPRPELEKKYYADLKDTDPTRPTLAACSYRESAISGPTAVKMNGPYDYVTPNYWYVDKTSGGAFGFNTETGPGPQPPPLESIRKMIPEDHLWPIDDYWDFHCARNEFNTLDRYLHALNNRYGEPKSAADFTYVAQVANYEAIRAMFEAFGVNKPKTSGIIQWMYNSAWPSMFWQLFDYYLMPGGAFYGARIGSEPLNIVYNYADKDIYIVNDTLRAFGGLKAEIRVLNFDSEILLSEDIEVSIGENRSKKILEIPRLEDLSPVYFIDLRIKDATGTTLGRNFYWLSTKEDILDEKNSTWFYTPNKAFADFSSLKDLARAQIVVSHQFRDLGDEQEIQVTFQNTSESIAFFIELNVCGSESGHSVLPIFWDDNYISLLPGETREILGRFSKEDLRDETPAFRYSGWNLRSE